MAGLAAAAGTAPPAAAALRGVLLSRRAYGALMAQALTTDREEVREAPSAPRERAPNRATARACEQTRKASREEARALWGASRVDDWHMDLA